VSLAPSLRVYRRPSQRAAFLESLLALIEELQAYAVAPEVLAEKAEAIAGESGERLRDVALLYGAYLAKLHEGGRDARDRLEKLEARDGQDQVVKLTREEDGTYTFTMPESPVTVSAVFAPIFQDVAESDWFYAAVQYVYEQGIMSGVEEGRFEPGTTLTRAMLAQTLYAMEGKPQVSGGEDFSDVEEGDWYVAAVAWAAENGLVSGVGGDRFAPNDALTREQMALILYRYAQHKSYDVQVDGEPLEGFQDVEKISDWAVEAMAWAVNAKLLSGTGDNLLTPAGTATRAQVAQVLANFCQTVA